MMDLENQCDNDLFTYINLLRENKNMLTILQKRKIVQKITEKQEKELSNDKRADRIEKKLLYGSGGYSDQLMKPRTAYLVFSNGNKMFCLVCALFVAQKNKLINGSPFVEYQKMSQLLRDHERTAAHKSAVFQCYSEDCVVSNSVGNMLAKTTATMTTTTLSTTSTTTWEDSTTNTPFTTSTLSSPVTTAVVTNAPNTKEQWQKNVLQKNSKIAANRTIVTAVVQCFLLLSTFGKLMIKFSFQLLSYVLDFYSIIG